MSLELIKMLEHNGLKIITQLTPLEERLLVKLSKHASQVVPKSMLEAAIYGDGMQPASNCLEVLVGRVRRKLNDATVVRTHRGRGYMLALQPLPIVKQSVDVTEVS